MAPVFDYPGRLDGRERWVLPEVDGTRRYPSWLDGLDQQRAWAAELAARMTHSPARRMARGVPVVARVAVAAGASAVGGVDALAPRLRRLFLSLGPTFIKLGQLVSGGAGMFPDRLIEEFAGFRDRLPAEPFEHVRRVLNEDLPGGDGVFAEIDPDALAAASIAQVHAATLRDGRDVVVKIQRPDVRDRIVADITWLSAFARFVDRTVAPARSANLPGIIEYFAETLAEELDFRLEAENMLDVSEAVSRSAHAGGVAVPRPHPELVTRRVLVMERLRGYDSTDADGIAASGIDTRRMLLAGFRCFLEGAMVHGVFHGDLHPGNVMVLDDGRYGILDYGIVGRLSVRERRAFLAMMTAVAAGDARGQIEAVRDLGGLPPGADVESLAAELPAALFPAELRFPAMSAVAGSMSDAVKLMQRHHFRLPKLLVLLSKNLIFADDAVARFAPGLDLMAEAAPVFLSATAAIDRGDDPDLVTELKGA